MKKDILKILLRERNALLWEKKFIEKNIQAGVSYYNPETARCCKFAADTITDLIREIRALPTEKR